MTQSIVELTQALKAAFSDKSGIFSDLTDTMAGISAALGNSAELFDAFIYEEDDGLALDATFVSAPLDLSIPGIGSFGIAIGNANEVFLEAHLLFDPTGGKCVLVEAPLYIRCLDPSLLTPVTKVGDAWVQELESDGTQKPLEVTFSGVVVEIGSNGEIDLESDSQIALPPVRLGQTGFVVQAQGLELALSDGATLPAVVPSGSRGFICQNVQVFFPKAWSDSISPNELIVSDVFIGTGGFCGVVSANWIPAKPVLIGGAALSLQSLLVEFRQSSLAQSKIEANLVVPFFNASIGVHIGFESNGGLTVAVNGQGGLAKLSIPNVLDLELDSIGLSIDDADAIVRVSGTLIPKIVGLKCPPIRIEALEIDSKGNVNLPGGWLALPKQYSLDFNGFKVEITKFGLGREANGDKWFGFSGGIKLVDGLPAGVSVEGLRVTCNADWSGTPRVTLNGVGVELELKDVLYFKGAVAYRETGGGHRFDGDIRLELKSLKFNLDGQFVVGNTASYRFMAIHLGVDLPTGLPVLNTGLAVYGMEALFALRMAPNKLPDERWYGIGAGEGWYKRNPIGVTEIVDKWEPVPDGKAFGAGITFGTMADNGYTLSARALFAGIFPGAVWMLEGAASIARDRAKLNDDPPFRALAVFDNKAGNLLVGLDVQYKYRTTGKLIRISAGTEAFYDFNDPMAWRLYLGRRTPVEQRIQADVFNLFKANAYLMLDAHGFAMGAWIGYDKKWKFGPLRVGLEAWFEGNVEVSYKPVQFYGHMALHGAVELKAFGFGLDLTVHASVQAEVFEPKHLLAELEVTLKLPAPLPKKKRRLTAHCEIEFGPDKIPPPIPAALKSVSIEHMKVSTTWPLPAINGLFKPILADEDGYLTGPTGSIDALPTPSDVPVVPLDCRPTVHFARSVHDEALIGAAVQPPDPPWEWIGDPDKQQGSARVRYALVSVLLDKWTGSSWTAVAGKGAGATGLPELFGSWTPVPATGGSGVAQNRLMLWSKCGFDSFRHAGLQYAQWFADNLGGADGYPCVSAPGPSEKCLNFRELPFGPINTPFTHSFDAQISLDSPDPGTLEVRTYPGPGDGRVHALCSRGGMGIDILFAAPAAQVRIHTISGTNVPEVTAEAADGVILGPVTVWSGPPGPGGLRETMFTIVPDGVSAVRLRGSPEACITEICALVAPTPQQVAVAAAALKQNQDSTGLWSDEGAVLESHTVYRLRVATRVDVASYVHDAGYNHPRNMVQAAFFRTEGPPGLAALSPPLDPSGSTSHAALEDLGLYVAQTVPPTVPERGQPPLLPRPVYRGYDCGVSFNEDYVDLMYRAAGQDLALILYDRNNRPVRGRNGAVAVAENAWGTVETTSLSAEASLWLSMLEVNDCVPSVDETTIPRNVTLSAAAELLDPDMLYEARLVPLLLHDDFAHATSGVGRWQVHDFTTDGGASMWAIAPSSGSAPARLVQTGMTGESLAGAHVLGTAAALGPDPKRPTEDPKNWTDYRLSASLRCGAGPIIGLAFRWASAGEFYLFAMDQTAGAGRTLYRVAGGIPIPLAQDAVLYLHNRDYAVVIEAAGGSLRVWVDGALVFDVVDPAPIPAGTIAFHCSRAIGAAFSDARVLDLTEQANSVYRFAFTSSCYVNFRHQMHSSDDFGWQAELSLTALQLEALQTHSVTDIDAAVTDEEARAFDAIADDILGARARQQPLRTEIHRILSTAADTIALLVMCPEPIDYSRSSVALRNALRTAPKSVTPLAVKLIDAVVGAAAPEDEHIQLLVRDAADLTGWSVELRDTPAPDGVGLDDPAGIWTQIYTFASEERFEEGTLVEVVSGPPQPSPPEARYERRYRAPDGHPGTLELTGDCVDLRLVRADGFVEHAERFVADSEYSLVSITLLRKADGTAFIILPAGGAGMLPQGVFELEMEYRRDNSGHPPASIVFSEAGATTPESVTLQITTEPAVSV